MAEWKASNYKADEKEAARNRKRLAALIKQPGNNICADCPQKLAQNAWASINLGQFICFQCSGIHRNLGTHISKVRSLNLDSWNTDWVENMERWGNTRAAAFWEARAGPGVKRPTIEDANSQNHVLKAFIRDKYQDRLFCAPGGPPEAWLAANGGAVPAPAPAPAPAAAPVAAPAPAPAQRFAAAPAPAPAPARVAVAPKPSGGPDLFSFDEVAPGVPPRARAPPAARRRRPLARAAPRTRTLTPVSPLSRAAAAPSSADPFGLEAAPADNGFGNFSGQDAGFDAAFAPAAAPPAAAKDNIMAMFSGGQQQMGMPGVQMGMQQMSMGGMPPQGMGMGMPPQGMMGMPQQGMPQMGGMPQGMGMPQQMGGMRPQGMMGGMPMGGGMPQQMGGGMMGGMPQLGVIVGVGLPRWAGGGR